MQNSMACYSTLALLFFFVAVVSAQNPTQSLCGSRGDCGYGSCTGRACPNLYPGYKSQWPELKGVSAVQAKKIIEENPYVKAWIFPEGTFFPGIICSKRVLLITPKNDCPNGPVINSPFVGCMAPGSCRVSRNIDMCFANPPNITIIREEVFLRSILLLYVDVCWPFIFIGVSIPKTETLQCEGPCAKLSHYEFFVGGSVVSTQNSTQSLCGSEGECGYCSCTGRACPNLYPGYESQWPELEGISAEQAKKTIETDNPYVKAWIFPEGTLFEDIICCKRVLLITRKNDCPNGRVINSPFVG